MVKKMVLAGMISLFLAVPVPLCLAKEGAKPTQVEQLQRELQHSPEYKRMLILDKLSRLHTQEALGVLIHTMIYDKAKPVRRSAQRLLAGEDDPRIVTTILEALQAKDRRIRLAAVDVVGLVRNARIADYLIDTCDHYAGDKELVRLTLEALRELVYRIEPEDGFERRLYPFLQSHDKKIRYTTVIILSILGRSDSLPFLMKLWPEADKQLKIHLADAFANIGRNDPVPLLVQSLQEGDRELQLHAIYALAQIQSFSSLPDIYKLMHESKNGRVRMACLYALVEIPDDASIPEILKIFDTEDATTLHWAIYALSQLKAKSAGEQLIEKLDHPAPLVRASAATAIGDLNIKAAAPKLYAILENKKEAGEVQIAAARALIKLGDSRGAEVLWKELQRNDLELHTRLTYAISLGAIKLESIQAAVEKDLKSSKFTKSFTAALILGMQGDGRGRHELITALEHGYPYIRQYAIIGLEKIQDQDSYHALANTANDDPDPIVRILCAASLARAGYADFKVILWNALETKKEDIRSEAIIALGTIADEEIIAQLKWYLRREPSIPVKQTIQRVLREYRARQ